MKPLTDLLTGNKKVLIHTPSAHTGIFSGAKNKYSTAYAHGLKIQLLNAGYESEMVTKLNKNTINIDDYDNMLLLCESYIIKNKTDGRWVNYRYSFTGGARDLHYEALNIIAKFKGSYFQHVVPTLKMNEILDGRRVMPSSSDKFKSLKNEDFARYQNENITVNQISTEKHCYIGDSHVTSMYNGFGELLPTEGRTLFGALRLGLSNIIPDVTTTESLSINYGNIDIRHHLARQDNPSVSIDKMVLELEAQIKDLNIPNIEIAQLLPIENESRTIPIKIFYNGEPFYGSWQIRNDLRDHFNSRLLDMCKRNSWTFYEYPDFTNAKGELDFKYMETPRSVHLSPTYFRWNIFDNKPNEFKLDNKTEAPKKLITPQLF